MRRFDGRVALITGASRGIGLAVAERLVSEGATVVLTGRKPESLTAAVAQLDAIAQGHAVAVPGRADDPDHRAEVFELVAERFGHLDHLVNNAGINPAYGPALEVEASVVRKILEVNVVAALDWTRSAVHAGLSRSIVNTASVAGLAASPGVAVYGVSKAALLNLTQQLAVELAPAIRVNAVAPAVVRTRLAQALYAGDKEAALASVYPLGRIGEPQDVAGPVAFLLSDDAAWITGHTLTIDGGASAVAVG